jgi:hypothetical protein
VGRAADRPGAQTPAGSEPRERRLTTAPPFWAQAGITDVVAARAFLKALRARETLVLASSDADVGYPMTAAAHRFRGHGVTIATNVMAATSPPRDLLRHHQEFGLGATHVYCPHRVSPDATLAESALADGGLIAALRADRALTQMLVSIRSTAASQLMHLLGLDPVFCHPSPAAYAVANDKLALARAGEAYGFATLPVAPIADEAALTTAFRSLADRYGAGCIVRLQRGAGGSQIHHARTLGAARRIWRRLAGSPMAVLLFPYVPAARIRRNVASHGVVTTDGFAPLLFTDQIIRRHRFRGGRAVEPWAPADVAAIRAGLAGVARWFRDVGYVGAPAGIDGFLMDESEGPRFVVLDSNARLSATMGPWAAVTVLAERAGQPLAWCFELFRLLGVPLTLERLRRHLGADLLEPDAITRGGVLPTFLAHRRFGPFAISTMWAIVIGRDADHVDHLRRRVRRLGVITR